MFLQYEVSPVSDICLLIKFTVVVPLLCVCVCAWAWVCLSICLCVCTTLCTLSYASSNGLADTPHRDSKRTCIFRIV